MVTALFDGEIKTPRELRAAKRLRKSLELGEPIDANSPYATILMFALGAGIPCTDCLSMDVAPTLDKKSVPHTVACRTSGNFKGPSTLCPICFSTVNNQHKPHSLLQMLLAGYGKSHLQELKSELVVKKLHEVIQNVTATFNIDKFVYKRSPMTDLTPDQMFLSTYRVLISKPHKPIMNRISDYDMFLHFSTFDPEWASVLKAKLMSAYNSVHDPDLTDEIALIANAPKKSV